MPEGGSHARATKTRPGGLARLRGGALLDFAPAETPGAMVLRRGTATESAGQRTQNA